MSADSEAQSVANGPTVVDCALTQSQQTRNVFLYAADTALLYLAAPVTYVGAVQATLLKRLDFNDTICNLPASVYLWMTPVPLLAVWLFPKVRQLKPLLVLAFLLMASTGALAAVAVLFLGPAWVLGSLITGAALLGCANGVMGACSWEIIGRGVSESRRGQALGLAFGFGPMMAVVAFLVSQGLLPRGIAGAEPPLLPYPWNYAVVFGSSVPILALGGLLSSLFVVQLPPVEVARQPFVSGIFGGAGQFLGYRLALFATVAYLLVYSGNMVQQNITLYTREATGRPADDFVGYQQALRFGFKIVAGFFLGWLLIKTNPKSLLLATAGLTLAGVIWALAAPAVWVRIGFFQGAVTIPLFILAFGILGAGELFGVYYPNYILGCSPPSKMRRNMALANLLTMPVGFAGVLYGSISDTLGRQDKKFGFLMSFVGAMVIILAAIFLVLFGLPARPRPQEPDLDELNQGPGTRRQARRFGSQESGIKSQELAIKSQELGITETGPTLDFGEGVDPVSLRPLDLAVFVLYMLLLIAVGVYFTWQQKGLKSYLLADQNIHWIIVAISVLAALFSGITYLGAPTETYYHDLSYIWTVVSFFIATPITALVFLPFFRGLNLYTAYEYLERRFDRRLRWLASGLFITRVSCYLALAVYAPSLAIVQITGWPLEIAVLLTGLAATVYTTLGGMKAVIWTDSLQFLVLCGGIVLILGFAIAAVPGNAPAVYQLAAAKGRTRFLDLDLNPTVRVTIWSALLGGACNNLVQMVTDQISVQRYLTARSLEECQRALWFKLWVTLPLVLLFYLTGTVLFAYYQVYPNREPVLNADNQIIAREECPTDQQPKPLTEGQDRLLPFFVVRQLPTPLPGLLIAAVFGATMAVVSAGINALATAALMDFQPTGSEGQRTEARQFLLARVLTVTFGILATLLALVIGKLGTLVEATVKIMGLFGGPLLGIFFLGVLSRRANGGGALVGAGVGAVMGILVAFSEKFLPWHLSFLWTAFAAAGATFVSGWLVSMLFALPSPEAQKLVYTRFKP